MVEAFRRATLVASILAAVALTAQERTEGILILAHGGAATWNERVDALAAAVDDDRPTEVAFGMASRRTMQAAIDRLLARGVTSIVAVPLFVSSHSSVVRSTEYLLGLRSDMPADLKIFAKMSHGGPAAKHDGHQMPAPTAEDNTQPVKSPVPIRMTPALNRHEQVAAILVSRAKAISVTPEKEAVIVVAHGPVPEVDNQRWLEDMAVLADVVKRSSPYQAVDYLTVRDDAPAMIRDQATAELRTLVTRRLADGNRVLVVPLLLSFGGIERGIQKRLEGLDYTMSPQGLIPDARLSAWVREVTKR